MKIIHVPFTFYPEPVGGTEVYVAALAGAQFEQGHKPIIAAPGDQSASYVAHDLPVRRFQVSPAVSDLHEMYGDGDPLAERGFSSILDRELPDLVHMHALTRGASLRMARAVKRRNIPLVFSYHTPTVSCQRGTLLHMGEDVCDGVMNTQRCAECALDGAGLNRFASSVAGALPESFGRSLAMLGLSGGAWTAARMTELVSLRHSSVRALMHEVDHIVALAQWVKDVLTRNNIAQDKITVSRQGLCQAQRIDHNVRHSSGAPRLIFLGRLDPTKGVHILLEALKAAPRLDLELDIYGVTQGQTGAEYQRALLTLAHGDARVNFRAPVPASDVVNRISEYDALVVPSQWLETGPLVVLEAFAAGVPVIGSNLGGIAEFVRDGVDGLLVEFNRVESWVRQIERFCGDADLRFHLRAQIQPPRGMKQVAAEIADVYDRVLELKAA